MFFVFIYIFVLNLIAEVLMISSNILIKLTVAFSVLLSTYIGADYQQDLLNYGLPIINSTDEKDILPGSFRMTKVVTIPTPLLPSTEGLGQLNASGSSQFSELGLDILIKRIGKKKITVVNLRQEDGGFIEPVEGKGAIAFSYLMPMPWWTGEDPRGNRTVKEIEDSEQQRMEQIMKEKTFTLYGTSDSYAPTDTHQILYRIDIAVKRALTEKQLIEEKGLKYFRIPDKKFGNMEYEHVDLFVDFVKNLEPDEWVHFHCKKGQSRTTLFMIMYDMMRNADRVSAQDIIKRQGPLGLGGADLFGLPNKESWDHSFKKQWKEFLYQFHRYVRENKSTGFAISWSQWAEAKNIQPPPPVVLGEYYVKTTVASLLPNENEIAEAPVLVLNTINETKLRPQNFRSTQDLWLDPSVKFAREGLEQMRMSGSSQYTQAGIALLLEKLKQRAKEVVVVDLRHDDHLFVNGLNVSSFETKEALLNPRTPEMITESENGLKEYILGQSGILLHAIDTKYPKNQFDNRFNLIIAPANVETPGELITRLGAKYLLIGSKRFSEASDDDLDRFISYMRQMPKDTWYHFHCKKGKSRTTFFMTIFDMMKNADKLSMEQILDRQYKIGGSNLLDITPKDPTWTEEKESKKQWIVFLARFHRYAKENRATGFEKSWSQWSEENKEYQPNVDRVVIDYSNS